MTSRELIAIMREEHGTLLSHLCEQMVLNRALNKHPGTYPIRSIGPITAHVVGVVGHHMRDLDTLELHRAYAQLIEALWEDDVPGESMEYEIREK